MRSDEESQIKNKRRAVEIRNVCFLPKRDFPITPVIPTSVIARRVGSNLRSIWNAPRVCSRRDVGPAEAQ